MDQFLPSGSTVTLVHFMHLMPAPGGEAYRIVCMPGMTEFHHTPYHPTYLRANDVRATTCPACKKTELFTRAKVALGVALGEIAPPPKPQTTQPARPAHPDGE